MSTTYEKRTLVTGGAGFIGSNYLNYAVKRYPDELFINVDLLTYAADLKNLSVDAEPNYVFEKADIRDEDALVHIFEKYAPTHVIHFAAESHVDQSIEHPSVFAETNVIGTNNLAYVARNYKVERFHFISTDEVYGELGAGDAPLTEAAPYEPRNPYSASKAAGELLLLSYMRTYGLPVVISRSSNNYGPNQDATKLIPKFITLLLRGEKVPLYGAGKNIRSWLYVKDSVEAIDLVFRKGRIGEIYNIGAEEERTNIEVTRALTALLGKSDDDIAYTEDRPGHDFRYALSSAKIHSEFGWKATTSFDTGITQTVEHYRKKLSG